MSILSQLGTKIGTKIKEITTLVNTKLDKSGTYQIIQSFLFNTGTSGSNGDTRIRINGSEYAGGYSFASDSASWEKSVANLTKFLNVGDYIDVKIQSDQHLWGSSSGYSHSTLSVSRIGS